MFTPTEFALAVVVPFVVSMAIALTGVKLKRRFISLGGMAVAVGFLAGYTAVRGTPPVRPVDGTDWAFHATLIAGVFSLIRRPMVLRVALGVVAIVAAAVLVAAPINAIPASLPIVIAMVAIYLTFAVRETRPPAACVGVGLIAATSAVLLNAGTITGFQVGLSLAAASAAVWLLTFVPSLRDAATGWSAPAAAAITALLVSRSYADHSSQLLPLLLLLVAGLLPWAMNLKAFRGWRVWIIVLICALFAAAAAIPQALTFLETSTTAGEYGY